MTVEALVDKERKIVLPDELLESLQIQPDTRVVVETGPSYILIETRPPGLSMKNGILVHDNGRPLPPDHVNWIDQDREDRADELIDRQSEPGLYMDRGSLVYDAGSVGQSDVLDWIREDREARDQAAAAK